MKKKSESKTLSLLKKIFNVRYWADWDRLKQFTLYIVNGAKRFIIPSSADNAASFDAVKSDMGFTDSDLLVRQNALRRLSIIMLVVSILIFAYAIFNLVSGHIAAFGLSFVVSFIALVLAFRYHYWHFLIKERTLRCSINEWFTKGLLGKNNE